MDEEEYELDLQVFLKVLTEHIIPIIIAAILTAGIGFSLAYFIIPKHYISEALMYVENSSVKQEDASININDITAAQKLVNTCQILFTSYYVFSELSMHFDGMYTREQLSGMVKIEPVNSTEVLRIQVETRSPTESYDIANELITLCVSEFERVLENGSIKIVNNPTFPDKHSFPSAAWFTVIAGFIGLAGAYVVFLVKELSDTRLKPGDDISQIYDLAVFAEILDFENAGRSGYKYSKYGRYGKYGDYGKYDGYGYYSNESRSDIEMREEEDKYAEQYDNEPDEAKEFVN